MKKVTETEMFIDLAGSPELLSVDHVIALLRRIYRKIAADVCQM